MAEGTPDLSSVLFFSGLTSIPFRTARAYICVHMLPLTPLVELGEG